MQLSLYRLLFEMSKYNIFLFVSISVLSAPLQLVSDISSLITEYLVPV